MSVSAVIGCHRIYEIEGNIVVSPSAVGRAQLPSVLCAGQGGSLETSSVQGHAAKRSPNDAQPAMATVFCSEPSSVQEFNLDEWIYYGSIPRRAHVYAWLAPVPAAQSLCADRQTETVQVDVETLKRLMTPSGPEKYRRDRALTSLPCGENPSRSVPMTFAVTFDPEHRTWEEQDGGRWIERRVLRIE